VTARPLLSVVVPLLDEADCLPHLHAELARVCERLPLRTEFLFVDDGSTDGSDAVLEQLASADPRVRFLSLSRNFGHQAALTAGLAHAAGDVVVTLDADLQHPPALIPDMLRLHAAGFDVVNTVRRDPADAGPLKRLCSAAFYRVFNAVAGVRLEPGGADFRLLGRPVVDALRRLPERQRFLRGLVPWVGFRQTTLEYAAADRRAGRAKYGFARSLGLALDGLTAFSFYPLRRLAALGFLIAMGSFAYGLWAIVAWLVGMALPGWTSLAAGAFFLGGCQLLFAGVLGEYLGRVLDEVKGRPVYVVRRAVGVARRRRTKSGRVSRPSARSARTPATAPPPSAPSV
jgi:glycosyltransferase involved in cell wall biosynthesis